MLGRKLLMSLMCTVVFLSSCHNDGSTTQINVSSNMHESMLEELKSNVTQEPIKKNNILDNEAVSAYLVETESLGGIKLGMTENEVFSTLGEPADKSNIGETVGDYGYKYINYFYDVPKDMNKETYVFLSVGFVDKGLGRVVNTVKSFGGSLAETSLGIKIGSKRAEVQDRYGYMIDSANCSDETMWDIGISFRGLRFTFNDNQVDSITLGDLIPGYPHDTCEEGRKSLSKFANDAASIQVTELESLNHIKLGMTESDVLLLLGPPDLVTTSGEMRDDYGYGYTYYLYGINGVEDSSYSFRVAFVDKGRGNVVNHLKAQNSDTAATSTGIKTGSRAEEVKNCYDTRINNDLSNEENIFVGFTSRGLHFTIEKGRVITIELGYLIPPIDSNLSER